MTPLRLRMIEDMRTAGLASGTQALYLDAVRNLAAHYRRSPDKLSEEEVRAYLLSLREWGVALGTFKTNHGGIQFLYRWTLDREVGDPCRGLAGPASVLATVASRSCRESSAAGSAGRAALLGRRCGRLVRRSADPPILVWQSAPR
jgi:hypothetical protein